MVYKKKFINIVMLILLSNVSIADSAPVPASSSIDDYEIIIEDYAPFSYVQNNEPKGILVDLLGLVLKNLHSTKTTQDISLLSWARGYYKVELEPNTVILSMTKTEERQHMFKWVGPIIPTKIVIMALKSRKVKISKLQDLEQYTIGTVTRDVAEQLLLSSYIPEVNISSSTDITQNIKKLSAGRIDMIAYEEKVLGQYLKEGRKNIEDYEVVYILDVSNIYFAFNKNTPAELINKVQDAFDQVKQSPKYKEVLDKY